MQKIVILIAGMHRSGTSMMARLLNILGVYLPLEMEYKDQFNESGYWESFVVQKMNDEILRSGGSIWFDNREFSLSRQSTEVIEGTHQRVANIVNNLLGQDSQVLALKDPRFCRYIPIWNSAFEDAGAKVTSIMPFRNPLEVAASIKSRDGFSTKFCLSMWLRNVLEAEFATRKLDRVFCNYQDILSDWQPTFIKIKDQLHLSNLQSSAETDTQVDNFISASLSHWRFIDSDLANYVGTDDLIYQTFQLLKQAVKEDGTKIHTRFDIIREKFNQTRSINDDLECRNSKVKSLKSRFNKAIAIQNSNIKAPGREPEVVEHKPTSADSQTRLLNKVLKNSTYGQKLEDQLSDLQKVVDVFTKMLADSKKTECSLSAELHVKTDAFTSLENKYASLSHQFGLLDDSYTSLGKELTQLSAYTQDLHDGYHAIHDSYSWKITWPIRAFVRYFLLLPGSALAAVLSKLIQQVRRLRGSPRK